MGVVCGGGLDGVVDEDADRSNPAPASIRPDPCPLAGSFPEGWSSGGEAGEWKGFLMGYSSVSPLASRSINEFTASRGVILPWVTSDTA